MLLYQDVISGDEMFSDAFELKLVDDIVYEVDCAMVSVKAGVEVDIGANPSAEEEQEALEDGTTQVNNVISTFRLESTVFDKKTYVNYLGRYMKEIKKRLETSNPDRVKDFERQASAYAKKIVANFKHFEFYTGSSMAPEGMVALLNYRENGITPYFTFWKDGLKEVKL